MKCIFLLDYFALKHYKQFYSFRNENYVSYTIATCYQDIQLSFHVEMKTGIINIATCYGKVERVII